MTTALCNRDFDELGIDPPKGWYEAWRNDDTSITFMVPDEHGGCHVDPPNVDYSGEDAWEWISFDDGRERDEWLRENAICAACGIDVQAYWNGAEDRWLSASFEWGYSADEADEINRWSHCPASGADPQVHVPTLAPTDILIERYEHGLVNYAPIGESSRVDRQWDVAPGVAVIRFLKPDHFNDPLIEVARIICQEYTAWCNGDIWGMIRYELQSTDTGACPFLEPADYTLEWAEADSCWGFVGHEYAQETAKTGEW